MFIPLYYVWGEKSWVAMPPGNIGNRIYYLLFAAAPALMDSAGRKWNAWCTMKSLFRKLFSGKFHAAWIHCVCVCLKKKHELYYFAMTGHIMLFSFFDWNKQPRGNHRSGSTACYDSQPDKTLSSSIESGGEGQLPWRMCLGGGGDRYATRAPAEWSP